MNIIWLFIVPTPSGPQPFAALFTEPACNLLAQMFAAAGAIGQCMAVIPGVAS